MTATITQNDAILALLQSRPAGLTPIEALNEVGCFRLAARVGELRSQGHLIVNTPETRDGRTWARYRLLPSKVSSPIPEMEQRALWGDR